MKYRLHIPVALCSIIPFYPFFNSAEEILLAFFLSTIAAIAPDTDCTKSASFKFFVLITLVTLPTPLVYLTLPILIAGALSRHRGFMHSVKACVLFSFISLLVLNNALLSALFFLSYLSHLVLDEVL